MNHKTDFHEDLSFGVYGEYLMGNFYINLINEKLEKLNKNLRYSITDISKNKDWDFKALGYDVNPETGKTSIFYNEEAPKLHVEVKTDKYKKRTMNLFIELRSRGKKSGIMTTKSNYYIYFFIRKDLYPTKNVFIFKTEELREIVRQNSHKIITGGDNNTSSGVLLSFDELSQYSDKFLNLTFNDYELNFGEDKKIEAPKKPESKGIDIWD